jgi:hypothetical protein
LYSIYMNDTSLAPGVYLCLSADDTCVYATDRKDSQILRKLQRGLTCQCYWDMV